MTKTPTIPDFNLNNPKNYFGYTLAVAASEPDVGVNYLMEDKNEDGNKITSDIEGARNGARHLGLLRANSNIEEVTNLGRQVVAFTTAEYGSETAALDVLRSLFGRSKPFVETLPEWETITKEVILHHSGIVQLISFMQEIHTSRDDGAFPLPILVQEIYHRNPEFAYECFFTTAERDRVRTLDWQPQGSDSTSDVLWEKSLYRSSVVHQLKSMLCHAGILTTKGQTRKNLEFSTDSKQFMWALTPAMRESTVGISWKGITKGEQLDVEEQTRDAKPPKRTETTTSRIIRNTAMVKTLKTEYNHRCQICGDRRQQSTDKYYAEGHHLHPLGEDGPDVRENIVIVCPTCHVDFDYGMLTIDPETFTITHCYDDSIDGSELMIQPSHTIGRPYLEYHNQKIVD